MEDMKYLFVQIAEAVDLADTLKVSEYDEFESVVEHLAEAYNAMKDYMATTYGEGGPDVE